MTVIIVFKMLQKRNLFIKSCQWVAGTGRKLLSSSAYRGNPPDSRVRQVDRSKIDDIKKMHK